MAISFVQKWSNNSVVSNQISLTATTVLGDSLLVAMLVKDGSAAPTSPPAGWTNEISSDLTGQAHLSVWTTHQSGGYFNNYYTWFHGYITDANFNNFVIGGANGDRVYAGGAGGAWFVWENKIKPGYSLAQPSIWNNYGNLGGPYVGFAFNAAGTKLITADNSADVLKEFTLTAWELSTVTGTAITFDFSGETSEVHGIQFKPDGLKMWLGDSSGDIHEYSLSSAFDINSTVTHISTFSHGTANSLYNFAFSDDGTKLFCGMGSSIQVKEYTLATPWLISTASLTATHSLTGDGIANTASVVFKPDGTEFSVGKWNTETGMQRAVYSLSTPWDLTTRTYVSIHDVKSPANNNVYGVGLWGDSDRFCWATEYGVSAVTLSTPMYPGSHDEVLSGIEYTNNSDFPSAPKGFWVKTDGMKFYLMDTAGLVHQYSLGDNFDFADYTKDGTYDVWAQTSNNGSEISCFNQDGSKLYIANGSNNTLYQFSLTTPWDVTGTVVYDGSVPIGPGGYETHAALFSDDGLMVQVCSSIGDGTLYEYTLSSPNDLLSTVTATGETFDLGGSALMARRGMNVTPVGTATHDRHAWTQLSGQKTFRKVGFELPGNLIFSWDVGSETACLYIAELTGVDESVAFPSSIKDNGKVDSPNTDANATAVDFLFAGFGSDQYQPPHTLDAYLTLDQNLASGTGAGDCSELIGYKANSSPASIPAMTHGMASTDECGGFYIGFVATVVVDGSVALISPDSFLDADGATEAGAANTADAAFDSPNSYLSAAGSTINIVIGSAALFSPNSYLAANLPLDPDNLEFSALQLAYDIAGLGIERDFRYFQLLAHLSPDIEVPMKRFTLRRINSGTASGLAGTVTFDAFIPRGFDDILNQLEGASVTLNVAASYQNQPIFTSLATVDISRVKFMAGKDSIYGESAAAYPLRPDSIFDIPNREIIFSAPNQIRTLMRDDIFPGMYVKARGVKREITQVTMYAEYNSGLTEILMR